MTKVLDCWNLSAGAECQVGTLRWSPRRRIHGLSPSVSHLPSGSRSTCGGPLLGTTPWRVAVSMGRPMLVQTKVGQDLGLNFPDSDTIPYYSHIMADIPKNINPSTSDQPLDIEVALPATRTLHKKPFGTVPWTTPPVRALWCHVMSAVGSWVAVILDVFQVQIRFRQMDMSRWMGSHLKGGWQKQQFTDFTDFSSPFPQKNGRICQISLPIWPRVDRFPTITHKLQPNYTEISGFQPFVPCFSAMFSRKPREWTCNVATHRGTAELRCQALDRPWGIVKNGYSSILWNSNGYLNMMDFQRFSYPKWSTDDYGRTLWVYLYRSYSWLCPECFGMSWSEKSLELDITNKITDSVDHGMIGCQRCLREPELVGCHELSAADPTDPRNPRSMRSMWTMGYLRGRRLQQCVAPDLPDPCAVESGLDLRRFGTTSGSAKWLFRGCQGTLPGEFRAQRKQHGFIMHV